EVFQFAGEGCAEVRGSILEVFQFTGEGFAGVRGSILGPRGVVVHHPELPVEPEAWCRGAGRAAVVDPAMSLSTAPLGRLQGSSTTPQPTRSATSACSEIAKKRTG